MTTFLKKHKKNLIIAFSSCFIIIALVVANALASMINPVQSHAEEITCNGFDLYLISLSKSQIESESSSHAEDYQKLGAGGFIWQNDGYYHVISSGYLNKADAELVQQSIKLNQNIDSELLKISFNSHTIYGNFSAEEGKVVGDLLSSCLKFYSSIYDIAISLDTNVFNQTTAKLAANSVHNDFANTLANFNTLFPKPHPASLSPLYEMTINAYKSGEKLCSNETVNMGQNYSSLLKYRYLEVMKIYYDFCN